MLSLESALLKLMLEAVALPTRAVSELSFGVLDAMEVNIDSKSSRLLIGGGKCGDVQLLV